MSHISKIELEVTDLDALKAAVKRLHPDLVFKTDQKTYRWYGKFVGDSPIPDGMKVEDYGKCDHAIGFRDSYALPHPNPKYADNAAYARKANNIYELGIVRTPGRKGYTLVYDNFCGGYGLEEAIGQNAAKLKQAYSREVTMRTMRRQGYRVQETTEADGTIRLSCIRPGKG